MNRVLRRPAALAAAVVLISGLAACGSDDGADEPLEGFEAVSISGELGEPPEVDWKGRLDAAGGETKVLVEGDGAEVESGDQVEVNVWVGNGFTQEKAYSTYDEGGSAETFTVDDQLNPAFKDALVGQTIGSRVAVTTNASDLFGEAGNPQMGIGNEDDLVVVLDLMEMFQPPEPKDVVAKRVPSIVEENGDPVSLDFSGVAEPKPKGNLLRRVVSEGDGKTVTSDMTVTADYLGMVYRGKKPFDESYSGEPVEFPLSNVVPGWTYGLDGVKVGSRVLLQIPPELGYGAQEQQGIPANSTLYFVIDVVSAK